ncbi:hypothetical protein B0T24DRAFT_539708, partial [Lasiosphaeria ovina]
LVIYQGYRTGFLSLNVSLSSLDTTTTSDGNDKSKYAFVAMSRDTVPSIAPPVGGWDAYWSFEPRRAQAMAYLE